MDFDKALVEELAKNGGTLSFDAVVNLLPPVSRHKAMHYLVNARNAGLCAYNVKNVDGVMTITVTEANS